EDHALEMNLTDVKGRGCVPAAENIEYIDDQQRGPIVVHSIYSPVTRVPSIRAAPRLKHKTDYDLPPLTVWSAGTTAPALPSAELQRRGLQVVAAQIPLTSFSDDVAVLRRVLRAQTGPVVLAGHSYGGAVITAAATGDPRVKALVYVAAVVPDEGETVGEIFH